MENEELRVVDILTDVGNHQGTVLSAYIIADATKLLVAEANGEVFVIMRLPVTKATFDSVIGEVALRADCNPTAAQMRSLGVDAAIAYHAASTKE
jgi:hypothetical protein